MKKTLTFCLWSTQYEIQSKNYKKRVAEYYVVQALGRV